MKRTESFIHDFKTVKIELITNIDDTIMKSLTPPKQSFLLDSFFTSMSSKVVIDDETSKR